MNAPNDRHEHLRLALEQLAIDTVGSLSAERTGDWVHEHIADGCPICTDAARRVGYVFDSLLLAARPVQPRASLRDRVMAIPDGCEQVAARDAQAEDSSPRIRQDAAVQVWNAWSATPTEFFIRAAGEGEWQPTATPGVSARLLRVDEARDEVTMVVRMEPGSAYPGHRHGGDEQCFVLEGDLSVGDAVMRAGDYQFAPVGSVHGVQSTQEGCTLLLISSRHDELIED